MLMSKLINGVLPAGRSMNALWWYVLAVLSANAGVPEVPARMSAAATMNAGGILLFMVCPHANRCGRIIGDGERLSAGLALEARAMESAAVLRPPRVVGY